MLRRVSALQGYTIRATDGDIGRVEDVLFEDRHWTVCHLVVDTGHWLLGRQVLIPPRAVSALDSTREAAQVALTRGQVRDSPEIDSDRPVSLQHHVALYEYFGFPYDWSGPIVGDHAGGGPRPDSTLRSAGEVVGYRVQALDGDVGQVRDFLVDDATWMIGYLVVDTTHWWPRRRTLVAPEWIARVSWGERAVHVDLLGDAIRTAPAYNPGQEVDGALEARLCDHYRRTGAERP